MKAVNLIGKVYGRLTVASPHSRDTKGRITWECVCACGATVFVKASSLTRKERPTVSCGCIRNSMLHRTHGRSATAGYQVWRNMHSRCANPNHPKFAYYGGRGIFVCDRWRTFAAFWDDMGPGAKPGLYLDRIDVDRGYEPTNCRWVSPKVSSENRRNAILVELDGERMNLSVAARALGVCYATLFLRHKRGLRGLELFQGIK